MNTRHRKRDSFSKDKRSDGAILWICKRKEGRVSPTPLLHITSSVAVYRESEKNKVGFVCDKAHCQATAYHHQGGGRARKSLSHADSTEKGGNGLCQNAHVTHYDKLTSQAFARVHAASQLQSCAPTLNQGFCRAPQLCALLLASTTCPFPFSQTKQQSIPIQANCSLTNLKQPTRTHSIHCIVIQKLCQQ